MGERGSPRPRLGEAAEKGDLVSPSKFSPEECPPKRVPILGTWSLRLLDLGGTFYVVEKLGQFEYQSWYGFIIHEKEVPESSKIAVCCCLGAKMWRRLLS